MYTNNSLSSLLVLLLLIIVISAPNFTTLSAQKQVVLSGILEDQGDPERWKSLILPAIKELKHRHPDLDIQMNYTTYPYNEMRDRLISAAKNHTVVDLVSLDQIWLGCRRGFLAILRTIRKLGRKMTGIRKLGWWFLATRYMLSGHGRYQGLWCGKYAAKSRVDQFYENLGRLYQAKETKCILRPEGIEACILLVQVIRLI